MKIGYIGAGAMGAPMITRLSKRFPADVLVFDTDTAVAEKVAAETGAAAAGSLAEIAAASDVLLSCVPNNASIRAVYLGDNGVASSMKSGGTTIDCSTVGPDATREVHAALAEKGIAHLDASMLGSVKQAHEGTISFVVGGEAEAFERAKPVLEACGQMILHCGPSGAGNHMKLIHQTLVAGHAVAVAEAVGLCLETGADVETFYKIVTEGTGFAYSRYFENRVPRMRNGDFSALFMLQFLLKDIRLAKDMAQTPETTFPMLTTLVRTFEAAMERDLASEDFSAVAKLVAERVGKPIERG